MYFYWKALNQSISTPNLESDLKSGMNGLINYVDFVLSKSRNV